MFAKFFIFAVLVATSIYAKPPPPTSTTTEAPVEEPQTTPSPSGTDDPKLKALQDQYDQSLQKIQDDYANAVASANEYFLKTGDSAKYGKLIGKATSTQQQQVADLNRDYQVQLIAIANPEQAQW